MRVSHTLPPRVLTALIAAALVAAGSSPAVATSAPAVTAPAIVAAVAAAPAADPLAVFYNQTPTWKGCGGGRTCATIKVPLDWAKPAGTRITLALGKLPAANPAQRLGALVINPGGPGASGLELLDSAELIFGSSVLGRYDIVGFDPRGVGQSSSVVCTKTTREMDRWVSVYYAATAKGRKAEAKRYKRFGKTCLKRTGALLRHVDTASSARDMDVIRAVLGEAQLDYVGFSYGTYLGTLYAELFPANVGRLVLDGAVNPALSSSGAGVAQLKGFDKSLGAFAKDYAKRKGAIAPTKAKVLKKIHDLIAGAAKKPLSASGTSRKVTQPLALTGVIWALYDKDYWQYLRVALRDAVNKKDGAMLLALADIYNGRDSETKRYLGNDTAANLAIGCLDSPSSSATLKQTKASRKALKKISPTLGEFWAGNGISVCANWPVKATGKPHAARTDTKGKILVIGTTGDPATPYRNAVALTKQLKVARLLTYQGEGHTAYGGNSKCVDRAVDKFLLTGAYPASGKKCS